MSAIQINQLDPRPLGEVGVQAKYLDGEANGIFHPFAGRMAFRPKLEILRSIVRSHPVEMVDVLIGSKRAPQGTTHNNPVFKNRFSLPGDGYGTNDSSVAILPEMPPRFSCQKFRSRFATLERDSTCLRTEFLFPHVNAGVRFARNFVQINMAPVLRYLSTFLAHIRSGRRVLSLRGCAPTFAGAIRGVFAKEFSVGTDAASKVLEWRPAVSAVVGEHFRHGMASVAGGTCIMRRMGDNCNSADVSKYSARGNK